MDAGLIWRADIRGADAYFGDAGLAGDSMELGDADYMDDTVFPIVAKACELVNRVAEASHRHEHLCSLWV